VHRIRFTGDVSVGCVTGMNGVVGVRHGAVRPAVERDAQMSGIGAATFHDLRIGHAALARRCENSEFTVSPLAMNQSSAVVAQPS
jgi:hypothetical protein